RMSEYLSAHDAQRDAGGGELDSISKNHTPSRWVAAKSRLRESAQGDKWSFCLTAGKIGPRIRREKGDRTLVQLAEQCDVHPNQISTWKDQLLEGAAEVFAMSSSARPSTPEVDIKALHAKIGELTLENDFLESALDKAGLLSARR